MSKTPVFVSWSGDRSKAVAVALCEWLRLVLQTTDPWCSPEIAAGDRWAHVVADRLHKSSVGVIVVTQENQAAPWLLFEAGALSKIVDRGKVIPYYVGLKPTDVQGPLSQFQGKVADKDGTLEMLASVNATIEEPHGDKALADLFEMWWPKLETSLNSLPKPEKPGKKRPVEDMVEEVLTILRRMESGAGEADRKSVARLALRREVDRMGIGNILLGGTEIPRVRLIPRPAWELSIGGHLVWTGVAEDVLHAIRLARAGGVNISPGTEVGVSSVLLPQPGIVVAPPLD